MKTNAKYTKKITAIFAAVVLLLIALICLTSSGCGYTINYSYVEYEQGEGYYIVSASGYTTSIKGELVIPSTYGEGDSEAPVKEIAAEGFRGARMTKLVIPASITKIGIAAFANCPLLKEVVFEEGCALEEIPQAMFGFDVSLTEIALPQSVKSIGYSAFFDCEKLETISLPENLKTIMGNAFENCYALSDITLHEGLESIGALAFYNCALTEVIIPNSVQELNYGAFHTCRDLKKVFVGNGITVIKSGVFGYCDGLEEIYISSSVKKIEGMYDSEETILGHAFHHCTSLKTINYAGTEEEWAQINIDKKEYTASGATFNNNALFKDKNEKLTINYSVACVA